jgi:CheY-like chemotaxis protein
MILTSKTDVVELNGNIVPISQIKEMRDSFTASIGHELRTPLTSILSMIELLKFTEMTSKQKDYIKFLDTSSLQLTSIINDILDYNKLETNNVKLDCSQINIQHCIDSAITIVAADFASVPLEYIVSISPGIPMDVIGDQSKIIQILINLIKNSAKFSPNNGKITVAVNIQDITATKKLYIVDVIDVGVGISPADLDKLFVPYMQLNKDESRRRYGGTGLGLIISKKLCNLMGGNISVKSDVGKGTTMTFTMKLDIATLQHRNLSVSNEIVALMRDKNVLIVDDTEAHRISLMQLVNNWGSNGTTCCSGTEALALLEMRTNPRTSSRGSPAFGSSSVKTIGFQLAILDYCMPGMNGRDLAIEIRRRGFEFPMIILSSLSDHISGPFHLTFKPINKSSIEDIVKSIMSPTMTSTSIVDPVKLYDKILIVDDYESIRYSISESLNHLGYVNIDESINGADALSYIKKSIDVDEHYKYIFMDIIMPVKGGVETVLEINKLYNGRMHKRPYIIALTASISINEAKYKLPENGSMNAYMAKPMTIERLKNIMIIK